MMGESEKCHEMLRVATDQAQDITAVLTFFAFHFSFHTLKEKKFSKRLFQKQAVWNWAALVSGNVTVVQVYNIMQTGKKKKASANFIPVITVLPYFPDGKMDSAVAINEETHRFVY